MLNDQASQLRKLAESNNECNSPKEIKEFELKEMNNSNKVESITSKKNKPKIITVTSGKGGVGKSNFVVNTAITLQKNGKKVLIFDADIGMGNDDVLMNIHPRYNIIDLLNNECELNQVLIEATAGVQLLPAGSGINKIDDLTEEQREIFLSKIEELENYDYIFIDTGAGISKTSIAFMAASDEIFLITTPEPTSLTDGYSLLKSVSSNRISSKIKVVVNRASNIEEADKTFDKLNRACEHFLKIKLNFLGHIIEDEKLIISVKEQKPFAIMYPKCNASICINNICSKLEENITIESVGIKGIFQKLFKIYNKN